MDPNTYLQQAKLIVAKQLAGHAVDAYLFGSRAKGEATRYSDIDIALLPKKTMPVTLAFYVNVFLIKNVYNSTITQTALKRERILCR